MDSALVVVVLVTVTKAIGAIQDISATVAPSNGKFLVGTATNSID